MPARTLPPTLCPRPVPAASGSAPSGRASRASLLGIGLLALALLGGGCGGDVESRMAEVRALQDVGQFTESLDELREILAIAPDLPEANYRLGVALMQTGEPSQAVWALKKAAESPDYAIVAGLVLAQAQLELQNFEEAVRAADRVLEIDPDRMMALQVRAQALLGAQRLEEALADTERLIELYPDDYGVRTLHVAVLGDLGRLEEAEEANEKLKQMGAESGDPDTAARACLAPAFFARDRLKDRKKAREAFEECVARYPDSAVVLNHTLRFFDGIGERERSLELVRQAVERSPENLGLRSQLANRLRNDGRPEEAERVLVEAVESFASAAAWNTLASFHRSQGEHEKALEAMEKVLELSGGGSDRLRFAHADLLIDAGEIERAAEVAESLDQRTYKQLIQGRIALARGDAEEAMALFEEGIRRWPGNAGARYLAGLAAMRLGDYERALSEFREAVRADAAATNASLHIARLHFQRGEYAQAARFATSYVRQRRGDQVPNALIIRIRALTALGQFEQARTALETLESVEGETPGVVAERAAVARAAEGRAAAAEVVAKSGVDLTSEAGEQALRPLVDDLLTLGRTDEAVGRVEAALAARPDAPPLHELHAHVLAQSGRLEEARAAYEEALSLEPGLAAAKAGLASLAAREGDPARAAALFDEAAASADDAPEYTYLAAQLTLAAGDHEGAKRRLREVVRRAPGHAGARNDLAWLLANGEGDLDEALRLAEEARRLDASPEVLDTLGWVHLKRGDADAAVAALEEAVAGAPDQPSFRYHLGMALHEAGDEERAREMLRAALDAGSLPAGEAEHARRELAQLERP